MIIKEIIGQICGLLVLVGSVISIQLPKRWQILLVGAAANFFAAVNQLLVGSGLTACFACIVATVNCSISAYRSQKGIEPGKLENIVWSVLYLIAWAAGFFISFANGAASALDIFTLFTTLLFIGHVLSKDERNMRIFHVANSATFFVYDVINLNIVALAKLFSTISGVIALYRYRNKKSA